MLSSVLLCDLLDAATALAACSGSLFGFDLCFKYILCISYLVFPAKAYPKPNKIVCTSSNC